MTTSTKIALALLGVLVAVVGGTAALAATSTPAPSPADTEPVRMSRSAAPSPAPPPPATTSPTPPRVSEDDDDFEPQHPTPRDVDDDRDDGDDDRTTTATTGTTTERHRRILRTAADHRGGRAADRPRPGLGGTGRLLRRDPPCRRADPSADLAGARTVRDARGARCGPGDQRRVRGRRQPALDRHDSQPARRPRAHHRLLQRRSAPLPGSPRHRVVLLARVHRRRRAPAHDRRHRRGGGQQRAPRDVGAARHRRGAAVPRPSWWRGTSRPSAPRSGA